jgi:hypothetical protein
MLRVLVCEVFYFLVFVKIRLVCILCYLQSNNFGSLVN